jgi:hypothetical protein
MPLEVPNLDDRDFTDLVAEARSMIPQYAPEWTNHNAADPGITLIELLAYVSEMLIYRLNRVTRESKLKFLQLLRGVTPAEMKDLEDPNTPLEKVDTALKQTVLGLRKLQRAVTAQDYEVIIKNLTAPSDLLKIMRSRCFLGMNLETPQTESPVPDCPGHVSVVIVPGSELDADNFASLLQYVREDLEPMRLLTTRLHVVKPFYLWLSLGAQIQIQPGTKFDEVRDMAIDTVQQYFNPLPDAASKREGWPFGRPVYLSEVYAQLEEVDGLDYAQEVRALHLSDMSEAMDEERSVIGIQIGVPAASTLGINTRLGGETAGDTERLIRDGRGTLVAVALKPYELVRVVVREGNLLPTDT